MAVVLALVAPLFGAEGHDVVSPDGRNRLGIQHIDGKLMYAVYRDGKQLVRPTEISITVDGKKLPGARAIVDVATQSVDRAVEPVVSTIASSLRDHHCQLRISFDEGLVLCLRAYNDGVAFRWELAQEGRRIVVDNEQMALEFKDDVPVYFPVSSREGFISHQESMFEKRLISKTSDLKAGPVPLLVELPGQEYLLVSDVNVEGYPGMWCSGTGDRKLSIVFPRYPGKVELKGDRTLDVVERKGHIAETSGCRSFPWRAFVIGDASTLLTATMLFHLAEESRIEDGAWIKPGKVAWDWWNALNISGVDFRAGVNQETYKHYIDFAAEMGIAYVILDEGWSVPGRDNLLKVVPEIDMPALIAYGRSRQVGVILWMTSAALEANFEKAFEQFAKWQVAGLKIDFMQRDDQVMMDFIYRAAGEAARHRMIVDFHGGSKPAGITRTWPNVLTIESVNGLEQAKWSKRANPEMAVLLPFVRMVVGPMDYTPGAMVNMQEGNFAAVFNRPASMGTRAHQLAMYVVYISPLQMLADSPTRYRANPSSLEFLRRVPVSWDETRVLGAEVGEVVLIARRKGKTWYVGGLTDWSSRDLRVRLDFLSAGKYEMKSWSDGLNADRYGDDISVGEREVDASKELKIHMAPGGGFAAILDPHTAE